MGEQTVRVLYIVGSGRSGSTLLASIMGQASGAFSAGELRFLWDRGIWYDDPCGCGEPFSKCPVWQDVMTRVAREHGPGQSADVAQALRGRLRVRRLPLLILRRRMGLPMASDSSLPQSLESLYRSIHDVTGGSMIIDSSKLPLYAALVENLPGVEVKIVHLVRDPRAAAYSWQRRKATKDRSDGGRMTQMPVVKSTSLWTLWNLLAARWWPDGRPDVMRLRYEDFASAPESVSVEVARFAGLEGDSLTFLDERRVSLSRSHTVAGNPGRHDSGITRVRADDEWRKKLSTGAFVIATALSFPGLKKFGYPLLRRGRS